MTPQEFLGVYGVPTPKTYTATFPDPIIIPYNEYRYLLAFWIQSADLRIEPAYDIGYVSGAINFPVSARPIILRHAIDGGLVNMSFRAYLVGAIGEFKLTTIEGFMAPPKRIRKRSK